MAVAIALALLGPHLSGSRLPALPLLVDQVSADGFLKSQLQPEALEAAARASGHLLQLPRQVGYDHCDFFVASFIAGHLRHHAAVLAAGEHCLQANPASKQLE